MIKRKMYDKLFEWKNDHDKKALMLLGARQVGKTFIVEKFANDNYEKVYTIDFILNEEYSNIFSGALDVETILMKASAYLGKMDIIPGKTLIFLDEIQACPNAITALKYLAMDNRFDVIASGSMLGVAYKRTTSFPVGYVNTYYMYSLDFEEFLWANNIGEESINYIKKCFIDRKPVEQGIHEKFLDLFKQYIVVGGMPSVVNSFIQYHDYGKVLEKQREIIDNYKKDVVKYANENDSAKILACFKSIPNQLALENKKFRYSLVDKRGTSSKYYDALEWLMDAGIINLCYNLKTMDIPLEGNVNNDCFKVYMQDTGLLMGMLEDGSQLEVIKGNLGIYKGAIYENVIADIFNKLNKKLYYFEHNSTLEIDFIIKFNNIVTAVEVKSADNTKSKSLNSVMTNWNVKQGIKLSSKNLGEGNNILNIPLYMATLI